MEDNTPHETEPYAHLASFVTFRLARVQNRLNSQAIATLALHSDLTLTEWRMVAMIEMLPETTAAEISRQTDIDKGQVSRAIKSLRGRGLVETVGNAKDQREQRLSLTVEGQRTHDRIVKIMRKRQTLLTENISDTELALFYDVLERLENRAKDVVR